MCGHAHCMAYLPTFILSIGKRMSTEHAPADAGMAAMGATVRSGLAGADAALGHALSAHAGTVCVATATAGVLQVARDIVESGGVATAQQVESLVEAHNGMAEGSRSAHAELKAARGAWSAASQQVRSDRARVDWVENSHVCVTEGWCRQFM